MGAACDIAPGGSAWTLKRAQAEHKLGFPNQLWFVTIMCYTKQSFSTILG